MCSPEKYLLKALSPDTFCLKCQKLIVHSHKSCNCNGKKLQGELNSYQCFLQICSDKSHQPSTSISRAALGRCQRRPGCSEGSGHVWSLQGLHRFYFLNSILVLQKGLFWSIILGQTWSCAEIRVRVFRVSVEVTTEKEWKKRKGQLKKLHLLGAAGLLSLWEDSCRDVCGSLTAQGSAGLEFFSQHECFREMYNLSTANRSWEGEIVQEGSAERDCNGGGILGQYY